MSLQEKTEKVILSLDVLKQDLIDYLAAKKANQKSQQLEFKFEEEYETSSN